MVAWLARAPLPLSCPTPLSSDCRLTSCWGCWQGLAMVAGYGNMHLRDQYGPVGKQTIRRHFQRDAISWNTVRRGLLQQAIAAAQAPQPAVGPMQAVQPAQAPVAPMQLAAPQPAVQGAATCAICLESCINASMVLECGHEFHGTCVARWFRRDPWCPMCRDLPARLLR